MSDELFRFRLINRFDLSRVITEQLLHAVNETVEIVRDLMPDGLGQVERLAGIATE